MTKIPAFSSFAVYLASNKRIIGSQSRDKAYDVWLFDDDACDVLVEDVLNLLVDVILVVIDPGWSSIWKSLVDRSSVWWNSLKICYSWPDADLSWVGKHLNSWEPFESGSGFNANICREKLIRKSLDKNCKLTFNGNSESSCSAERARRILVMMMVMIISTGFSTRFVSSVEIDLRKHSCERQISTE